LNEGGSVVTAAFRTLFCVVTVLQINCQPYQVAPMSKIDGRIHQIFTRYAQVGDRAGFNRLYRIHGPEGRGKRLSELRGGITDLATTTATGGKNHERQTACN
jgi:hypothetical protein